MDMDDILSRWDTLQKKEKQEKANAKQIQVSHKKAIEKAESEYEKYRIIQDQKYVSSMDEFYNKYFEECSGDK